jgi:transcriptional antiterminator RfaH
MQINGILTMSEARPLGWFCVRAEGRREHLAAMNLAKRARVEAFAPRIRIRRERKRGGIKTQTEPLFPGYIFARFKYPEQARFVTSTDGVLGLVAFGGPPPTLPDDTIAYLRKHTEPSIPEPTAPIFEEGEWVRVAAGCFRGTEGRVREFDFRRERACVLLHLLGHEVEISLPAGQLISRDSLSAKAPLALRSAIHSSPSVV